MAGVGAGLLAVHLTVFHAMARQTLTEERETVPERNPIPLRSADSLLVGHHIRI